MNIELTEDQKNKIYSDKELYNVMRQILLRDEEYDQSKEHFWCVGLATNSVLMYIELVSLGSLRQTVVEPMDVFSWAVQKRVDKVILAHNHPSNELRPNAADLDLTDRLIQVGRILNIPVVEHMIISLKDYYSFSRKGDIARLKKSKKYVPGYLEVERIQKEGQRLGEEIGIDKRNKELAKKMIKKGTEIEFISEITGLSPEEIEKL
ncbi:MAG: DNA repair protein [bacterium]|nr:DNA repair protein [bacterium]